MLAKLSYTIKIWPSLAKGVQVTFKTDVKEGGKKLGIVPGIKFAH